MDLIVNFFKDILKYLNGYTNDYGWALILLGVVTKLIIFPLYVKQIKIMHELQVKMKSIQPYLLSLQKKYKEDPKLLFEKQMQLYKTLGFNPLQGCFTSMLLSFIQIPILFAVFFAVKDEISILQNTSFLWIKSLAKPDLLLFVLYIFSMYVSFKITPSTYNTPEEKSTSETIQLIMLGLFAIIFYGFPSAFILYWFSFNIIGIIASWLVYKLIKVEEIDKEKLKEFEREEDIKLQQG
ncbi:MAG: YidC/Oxa1 family membrane protein insertase [Candidatus Calescibacterium sp.]|nr:YidC/Oxa1 family membrane protein insertase [Candidatus Calescibacterium sp.]MCX7972091.1 YidC/Oxa1 family membrane protein insertase [bacterium]MDW8194624.1 YidC/Oxa1 family membrane protein insertase [Candidatus Calescibacterium sp.]